MITSHERAWLKTMLQHPAATDAFTAETLDKLRATLECDQTIDISRHLIEKARPIEKQVYHPLLRSLRRHIMNKMGIRITYEVKDGRIYEEHTGFAYKLEYAMVKREWYLLWFHIQHKAFMSTRLKKIHFIRAETIELVAEYIIKKIEKTVDSRKNEVTIEIVRHYNEELSRIRYIFSSFDKNVEYDSETDTYRVNVSSYGNEIEYLLSKIRFLGKRVRIVQGDYLKGRMLETSRKALQRYESIADDE